MAKQWTEKKKKNETFNSEKFNVIKFDNLEE